MKIRTRWFIAVPFGMALLCTTSLLAQQRPTYTPIPQGFDFPADQAALLQLVEKGDTPAIRKHAWMVFAGLTQPTPSGEAVWETWYSAAETFGGGPQLQGVRKVQRKFRVPRQFQSRKPHPQAIGASLLSFTLFNEETRTFVRTNDYNSADRLTALNASFPASAPLADRTVKTFPNAAMSVKTVWWVVKGDALTPVPVWDPELNPVLPSGNEYTTWKRVVAVDPSGNPIPPGKTTTINFLGKTFPGSVVVPVSKFYSFKLSQNDLPAIHAISAPGARDAKVGDYAIFVGMHYTTKEIPQWVWSTFWWHDKSDAGPYAADRPDAVKGVWRNYLMSTTFNMDKPPAKDGGPPIAFNPWLEARFKGGTTSNCMACHQQAVWPSDGSFVVARGTMKPDNPIFIGKTKLDFLWSIADENL